MAEVLREDKALSNGVAGEQPVKPKAKWTPVAQPKCEACGKTVYEQEKVRGRPKA